VDHLRTSMVPIIAADGYMTEIWDDTATQYSETEDPPGWYPHLDAPSIIRLAHYTARTLATFVPA
jgi:hypothetical protein